MEKSMFYYAQTRTPEFIEQIEEADAQSAYKHIVLGRKLDIIWMHPSSEADVNERFLFTYKLQRDLIHELRAQMRANIESGKPLAPSSESMRSLSFSDIRNSLDKKPDERTINLYDTLLRERLESLPKDSYEDRAFTQTYILKNILKRKRFFVEARIRTYLDDLEYSLAAHTKKLTLKHKAGKSEKSKAIHSNTLVAFYSIAIELLSQVEEAFSDRGFQSMTMRVYILRCDYYTALIQAKWLTFEYIFRSIWKYSTNYGVDLLRLFQTTLYFLVVFVSLFYIIGVTVTAPLDKSWKAVQTIVGDPLYGMVSHPMLYNYNQAHDILFHYVFLTIKLMAFRVETGFIAITLPEKMVMIGAEVIGMILFGLLVVLVSKKIIAK